MTFPVIFNLLDAYNFDVRSVKKLRAHRPSRWPDHSVRYKLYVSNGMIRPSGWAMCTQLFHRSHLEVIRIQEIEDDGKCHSERGRISLRALTRCESRNAGV